MEKTKTSNRYSAEVRSRAVRMVLEHGADHASQWAAIGSIAAKIGCTGETLRGWVRQAERDQGLRIGPTSDDRERIKALERELRELRQANEILRSPMPRANHPPSGRSLKKGVGAPLTNKPEVGVGILRGWYDNGGVDMVTDLTNSAVALAASNIAREKKKACVVTVGGASTLT